MDPSGLGPSDVNCMFLSMELIWFRKLCCLAALMMTHMSSTNLFHINGGGGAVLRALNSGERGPEPYKNHQRNPIYQGQ